MSIFMLERGWMAIQLILLKQNPDGVVRENGAIYMFSYYSISDMFNYISTLWSGRIVMYI